jgi:hypothetical protein
MCVDDAIAGGGDPLKGINIAGPSKPNKPCGKLVKDPDTGGGTGNNGQPNTAGNRPNGHHGATINNAFKGC